MAPRVLVLSVLAIALAGCSAPEAGTSPEGSVDQASLRSAPVGVIASRLSQALDAQGSARLIDRGRSVEVSIPQCVELFGEGCSGAANVAWSNATFAPTGSVRLPTLFWDARNAVFSGTLGTGHGATGYSVIASDIDGDGIEEMLFHTGRDGGYGGPSYTVFRWSEDRDTWDEAPELSELTVGSTGVFSVDGKGGVSIWFADGCCRRIEERYAVREGKPRLIERRTESLIEGSDDRIEVKTEIFEDGKAVRSTTATEVREAAK